MAGSRLEEYQRQLEADPASAIFVELARELLVEGQAREAADVCLAGLVHHPDLAEARILCGRALLRLGRATDARAQFEAVLARNPRDPEVHATIGEALLERGLQRSAVQLIKKALSLDPADPRLQALLARAESGGVTAPRTAVVPPPMPHKPAPPAPKPAPAAVPVVRFDAKPQQPAADAAVLLAAAEALEAGAPFVPPGDQGAEPWEIAIARAAEEVAAESAVSQSLETSAEAGGERDAEPTAAEPARPQAENETEFGAPSIHTEPTIIDPLGAPEPPAGDDPFEAERTPVDPFLATEPAADAPAPAEEPPASEEEEEGASGPPPLRAPAPPPLRRGDKPQGSTAALVDALLGTLPAPPPAAATDTQQPADTGAIVEEAANVAAAYERELRERLAAEQARPPSWLRRHRLALGLGLLLTSFAGAGVAAYQYRRDATHAEDVARYTAAARNGLLRDTFAAYQASLTALDEVLDREPHNATARALKAHVLAVLSTRFGVDDADPKEAAALLGAAEKTAEPEVALATRLLLADAATRPSIEEEVLAVPFDRAGATVHSLAGAIHLARGEEPRAIERFNAAIAAVPGHVPTLVRVAEHYRARREYTEALRYDRLALAVVEDHPLALLGAAEAQLAIAHDEATLQEALASLGRMPLEAFPAAHRDRYVLAKARLLAGVEKREQALAELEPLRERAARDESLLAQLANAYLAAGAPDRAVELFRVDAIKESTPLAVREAWARALLARERFRAVTLVPARKDDRSIHLLQGIAWLQLGDRGRARTALRRTATRQAGKMPADAVVYLGLADLRDGQVEKARKNLERLGTGPRARTAGRWAWAEVLVRDGRLAEAETVLREAVATDRESVETRCALGRLLLERGDTDGARRFLAQAIARNPFHAEALTGMGEAALSAGDRAAARTHLNAAIEASPDSPDTLAALGLLEAREGDLAAADRRIGQAAKRAPRAAAVLAARAELALLRSQPADALKLFEEATRSDGSDPRLWLRIGELRLEGGKAAPARAAFARAARLDPASLPAALGEARALVAAGQRTNAAKLLQARIDAAGEDAPAERRDALRAALAELNDEHASR